MVATVMDDTAASRAGIKVGDEILKVDQATGRRLQPAGGAGQAQPGQGRHIEIRRDGQTMTVPLTIGETTRAASASD